MRNFKPPLGLGLMLTLAACGTIPGRGTSQPTLPPPSTPTPITTSATNLPLICAQLQIVQLSRKDTDGTKEQVQANNHVLTALCGK